MNEDQLKTIVAFIVGTQAAVAALAQALKRTGVIHDIEPIAVEMERVAADIGPHVANRDHIARVLGHIAKRLRDPGQNLTEEISRLLH